MSNFGSQLRAIAPTILWRIPPLISCGHCLILHSGSWMFTATRSSLIRWIRAVPAQAGVPLEGFPDLVPDGKYGIQGHHGVLQDHGDLPAPDLVHLLVALLEEVFPFEEDFSAHRFAGRGEDAEKGGGHGAFAATRLADHRQAIPRMDIEGYIVNRFYDSCARKGEKMRFQPNDLQEYVLFHEPHSILR